jgi:DNA-binding transcriptional regulator YhcF (GntR family)
MKLPKYQQVAAMVRGQVADGVLIPGASAPSGATLARETGYSTLTCRRALQALVKDGVLVPGASRNARPRVPSAAQRDQTLDHAKRELSVRLAGLRRAAGLTQPQLAEMTGYSVTTIGHAETGRVWQSRPFWELADKALNADGELLLLHDTYRAAQVPTDPATAPEEIDPGTAATAEPATPAMILIVWTDGAITEVPMTRETR